MAQSLSAFDALLKQFYGVDTVTELVKKRAPFYMRLKKSKMVSADGRQVIVPLHTARNVGVGARGENGNLPTAGNQAYVDLTIPYRYNHARIQLSAQVMKQSRTSEGAFEHAADSEIKGAINDMARDISRQLQGFGDGTLCNVSGTPSSTTINLVNGQGVADNDDVPARFILPGMIIAFIKADGTIDAVRTVSSVAANQQSIVLTSSYSAAEAGVKVVRASTTADAAAADVAYNNEIMGLLGMVDDGSYVTSYFSVTRSSNTKLNAYRLDLGEGNLTLDAIQKCFDGVDQSSDGYPSLLLGHHNTRREYLALLTVMKRYINERALSPDGGVKGGGIKSDIEFNEVPMKADRDTPLGLLYGVDESAFERFELTEGWADEDGTVLLRLSGTDGYEARYRKFANVACLAPNKNFVLSSIKINSSVEAINIGN